MSMTKISVLLVVCLSMVDSVKLRRHHHNRQHSKPRYQGQADEKEVPEETEEPYSQGNFTKIPVESFGMTGCWHEVGCSTIPDAIYGKNIVFLGDRVDRDAVMHMCTRYGRKMTTFSDLRSTNSVAGRKFSHATMKSDFGNHLMCHLQNDMNASLLYMWNPGVMTMPPMAKWAHKTLMDQWKEYLYSADIGNQSVKLESAQDLAKIYWRRAITDHLPDRPTIVVTQSSTWDTMLAEGFLNNDNNSYIWNGEVPGLNLLQEGLQEWGWMEHSGLAAWNWTGRATTYIKALREGLSPEKIVWRTQSNCPGKDDITNLAREFNLDVAETVRDKVAQASDVLSQGDKTWQGVKIMDWRKAYDARKDGCDDNSYMPAGYENYMATLWETLDDGGHDTREM